MPCILNDGGGQQSLSIYDRSLVSFGGRLGQLSDHSSTSCSSSRSASSHSAMGRELVGLWCGEQPSSTGLPRTNTH